MIGHRVLRFLLAASGVLLALWIGLRPGGAEELLPPGYRPLPLGVHALAGGNVVVRPGEIIEGGVIVIRDGRIQAVGKDLAPPADARVWNMKGMTIYAGFIDPYLMPGATNPPLSTTDHEPITAATLAAGGIDFFGAPEEKAERGASGPGYEVAKVTPERRTAREYAPEKKDLESLRELGFTAGVVAPAKGIIRGTSALVALSEEEPNRVILKADVFQHIAFETHQPGQKAYPGSLMGVIAAVRQSFFDAQHYALDQADYQRHPQDRPRPEFNPSLEALAPAASKRIRVAFEPGSALMEDRAARLAAELGLDFCLVSSGQEWRRPDLAKAAAAVFIVPLNFPTLPKLPKAEDWDQVSLDQLRAWDWAPENPALLRRQGLQIALTTYGLSDRKQFRKNLQLALDRGLSESDALAALTTAPAQLCGVESELGAIEAGKLANLTVVQGKSYFDPHAKVREVWIDGRICRSAPEEPKAGKEDQAASATPAGAAETNAPNAAPEKNPKPPEVAAQPREEKAATTPRETTAPKKPNDQGQALRDLRKRRLARSPLEGRGPLPWPGAATNSPIPADIVVRNATIWVCDEKGTVVTNGSLWVRNGKIAGAGSLPAPALPDALVIDGRGLHVTPGIIDCHSHTAILGAVNEETLPSTAMVRISDVVNSESDTLYEQLAGGVTAANLLHGSANPIGGQNCVIKLRDGASPEDLIFQAAPPGIKFALGENVKQSNWGEKYVTRFPQTRMGVRAFIANRFTAARQYLADWDAYRKAAGTSAAAGRVPPRRDLELEAIGEIIQGNRWIHCHSYRQDEILMLIRLMESFGVRIGTFQHALEGYKVADEIARHGAGASAFSDWWGFKFEVYDAIPYNGSLMRDRGVLVSFNSDSSELARRLYGEAAKAVKYGGTPEAEALKFVTLNPAKQLRVDPFVGSLEPGKDADFAIWSKSPLDSGTVCLQTWIEGKKYFDRSLNPQHAGRLQKERDDLLAEARQAAKLSGEASGSETASDGKEFFRISLEHQYDGQDRGCVE
jgi:imidazolonepropionase-like amidohydrolase